VQAIEVLPVEIDAIQDVGIGNSGEKASLLC
jgi:hypothetical protein